MTYEQLGGIFILGFLIMKMFEAIRGGRPPSSLLLSLGEVSGYALMAFTLFFVPIKMIFGI